MITCRLYGRLGNQMFQIAATIAHALDCGLTYRIPKHTINPDIWPDHPFNLIEYSDEYIASTWYEPYHNYHPIPHIDHLQLDGYFQSYKYFEKHIDIIRHKFSIPDMTNNGILGIHIRAGDYKLFADKHPIPPKSYYQQALKMFRDIDISQVIIFTDEPKFAKSYFPEYPIMSSANPLDDFYRMCMCEHLIIANSSYSLMAALLNPNPNKIIVAVDKSQYFGPGNAHLKTQDIYPKYFKTIRYA